MTNPGNNPPESDRFDFSEDADPREHKPANQPKAAGDSPANSEPKISPAPDSDTAPGNPILDTRARLIETARDLFLRQGYYNTGVKQILRAANANSGSLYHYFPTKEDLLLAVLDRYIDMLQSFVIQPVFDRITDPIERVFGILDSYRRMLQYTHCQQGCPIGNLALELSDTYDNVRNLVALNFTNWKKVIEHCLDDAADRLPDDCDRAQLASFVLTIMEGSVMQTRAYKSIEPFESAVALLRDYFDRLIQEASDWSTAQPG